MFTYLVGEEIPRIIHGDNLFPLNLSQTTIYQTSEEAIDVCLYLRYYHKVDIGS